MKLELTWCSLHKISNGWIVEDWADEGEVPGRYFFKNRNAAQAFIKSKTF